MSEWLSRQEVLDALNDVWDDQPLSYGQVAIEQVRRQIGLLHSRSFEDGETEPPFCVNCGVSKYVCGAVIATGAFPFEDEGSVTSEFNDRPLFKASNDMAWWLALYETDEVDLLGARNLIAAAREIILAEL